jgi:hypothetical protein
MEASMALPTNHTPKLSSRSALWLLGFFLPFLTIAAQQSASIDPAKASIAFAEAQHVSEREAGRLWGKTLYGPILFVLPATREIVANQPDADRQLHKQGNVYIGSLPKDMMLGNTAIEWSGTYWMTVMWPLPQYSQPRERLLAHEFFHRIQPDLHLQAASPENSQLDSLDGRFWLQLEWRALAAALTQSSEAQARSIHDALDFRAERHKLFPDSQESERALELNEGLAEYTGLSASAPDAASARWRMITRLTDPEGDTFVRSFAYASGPAYGLLLDERVAAWRLNITQQSDLGLLLGSSVHVSSQESVNQRALQYGSAALRISETERAAAADTEKARYHALLVDGATLTLPNAGKFNYGFDPSGLVPLVGFGTVYPTMQVSDAWGTLDVQEGALLASDFKSVRVAAPSDTTGTHIKGPGWTLTLSPGWHIDPSTQTGSFTLGRD